MARWIVAGVLLAVLIGLIVMDASGPELGGPTTAPAAGTVAAGAPAGEAPTEAIPTGPELPDVTEPRPELDAACGKVKEDVTAAKGAAYLEQIGDKILTRLSETQFAAICTEIASLPVADKVARLEAVASGG